MSVLVFLRPSSTVFTLRNIQGHTWYKRTVGKKCVIQESGSNSSVPAQVPTLSPFVQTDSGASQSYLKPCISRWHRWFGPLAGCSAASLPQTQEAGLELYCSFCFLPLLCPVGECSYQSNTFSSNPGFPLASPWAEGNFIVFPNSCTELWCSLALSLAVPPSNQFVFTGLNPNFFPISLYNSYLHILPESQQEFFMGGCFLILGLFWKIDLSIHATNTS